MIDIKDTSNNNRLSTQVNEGSIYKYTLMKEEYILLKFSVENPIYFRLGDYTYIYEGLFEIVDLVFPIYNKSTGGYDYDLRMDAHYWKWKHKKLFYDRQKGKEAKWSLTRTPDAHMSIVVSNIAALGYTYKGKPYVFSIDATVKMEPIFIQYDNTNIIDGISMIAEACGCEWWVKENYIFLGHCEDTIKDIITLEMDNELSDMTRSDSTSTYATRIISFGSERNIPKNYRPDSDDLVIEGVVQRRLKLPEGIPYVDAYPDMTTEEAVEDVVLFDNVYPRRIGTISEVNETRGNIVDENEKPTGETYPIFTIKDAGLKNFKKEYLLDELRLVFQSGSINGMHFALELKSSDDTGTVFEIARNQNYGQFLPNDTMKPKKDGTYVLYGYDTSFISDTLIGEAEQELLEETQKYVEKSKIDPSVYTCPTNPVRCAGYIDGKYNQQKEIDLEIGRRVKLINKAFFKDGRESRIYGFEKKLDNPFECTYTIGESTQYSRIGDIENRLDELKYNGNTYINTGNGSGGIYHIKTNDPTYATDQNAFTALRTLYEIKKKIEDNTVTLDARYLRKDIDDIAQGNITFDKNIFVGGEAGLTNALIVEALYSDIHAADFDVAGFHLSAEGDAWLNNIYAKKDSYFAGNLSSPNFSSGFPAGYGWAITWRDVVNAAGVLAKKTHLEIDDATFRGVLRVYEMVISQLLGENGTHLTTDMMKIKSVDIANKIIYLDTEENVLYNPFWTDDVLMVQRFNGMPSVENNYYVTKQYEFAVEETHIGSVDEEGNRVDWIKYKNFVGDESLMTARDTLVRVDNLTNPDRKGIIKQTSVEPGSPYMDIIYAMKTDPENAIRSRYGKLEGLITSYWGQLSGYGLMCDNAYLKGHFMLHTGEDVKTKFEIMEGLFRSEISSIKTQISTKDNYLSNASFATNTDKWSTVNEQNVFAVSGRILMFNNNLYANKKKIAAIVSDAGKRVLRIKNSQVRQVNSDLANKPSLDITGETVVIPTFYVSLKYRCLVPSLLKVGFAGKELYTEENVSVSNDYVLKEFSGKWDGTGDFIVECTGDVYITMLALTTDALADFKLEMKTIIEQTDEHIKLLGEKIDKQAGTITNLGIELDNVNESLKLYATKATVNDLESRYQSSMLELTPAKINATVSEQITRVSEAAKAAAIAVANKAQESANKGIADAKAAGDRLTGWASDGVISPPEKLTLKQEAKDLASEKVEIIANAGKYGIATTGYVNAYNAYLGELNYHSTATPENIAIRTTFATYQTAYYNARQSILDQIAAKTKQSAEDYADNVGKTISASLNIEKGRIDALAGKFDANGKLIEGAGWITTTQGNTLWVTNEKYNTLTGRMDKAESSITQNANSITQKVSSTDFNGQTIISKVNQTSTNYLIEARHINLIGAVSFSMLSDYASVNNRINGKAETSSLGDLAYQDYVYSRDLAKEITDTITAKVSPNQLRNYAFANGASITKSDLVSALQTEITGKLTGTATSSGNKLASVIVNGQTLVAGGYIQANLINADEIWCTSLAAVRGRIASFSINENSISIVKDGIYSGFGIATAPAGLGLNVPLWIRNTAKADTCVAAHFEASGGFEHNYALSLIGGLQMIGGYSNMGRAKFLKFSEGAGSNSIQLWFKDYDMFIINNNSGKYMSMYLPRYDGDITGDYKKTSFIIEILQMTGSSRINLCVLGNQTYIRDSKGNIINDSGSNAYGNVDMDSGHSIRLIYFGQTYFVLNRNY